MPLHTVIARSLLSFALAGSSFALPASARTAGNALLQFNRSTPERVLYSFQGNIDGASPRSTLVSNGRGGFYGTTEFGGGGCQGGCGTVFRLIPRPGGGYEERIAHRFTSSNDGTNPEAGLVADSAGNLYGTTVSGGNGCFIPGCGVVYKLTPRSDGGFDESILYVFSGGSDGSNPTSSLIVDSHGDLIGTAGGGSTGEGVVFQLTRSGNARSSGVAYAESVLYTFGSKAADGTNPSGPVVVDARGNLYGSTSTGGSGGVGTVYRLAPTANGYVETTLYDFTGGSDGASPAGPLAFGPSGVLYGTAFAGGYNGAGVVFSLTPVSKDTYAEKAIRVFTTVGAEPAAGVYVDPKGELYGTTAFGGLPGCSNGGGCGIVFRLTPTGIGFTYDIMHVFGGGRDASEPFAGLIPGPGGELYGTTMRGGTDNSGTVFRIK